MSTQPPPVSSRALAYLVVGLVALLPLDGCGQPAEPVAPPGLTVADVLGAATAEGFDRALEPRRFVFPEDHGAHPGFAAEWWYFTGNLASTDGRRFGYQLTFFRTALAPPGSSAPRTSGWASDQIWMAHFALTDVDARRFHASDRFQRGALDLAGAAADPWRVWLDDWSLEQTGAETFPVRLRARQADEGSSESGEEIAIDLRLSPIKPMVLQGEAGLSAKGPSPGNASYYYSFSRIETTGMVRIDDTEFAVDGFSWLDREWSTSALEAGQVGWDWFALQLSDGTDLMFYQLRREDGSATPQSAGALIDADGAKTRLAADDVDLTVESTWRSPRDGTIYPSAWTMVVPDSGISLRIESVLDDQELELAFRYWEGAVRVQGVGPRGAPVSGRGYVELTGYAEGGRNP